MHQNSIVQTTTEYPYGDELDTIQITKGKYKTIKEVYVFYEQLETAYTFQNRTCEKGSRSIFEVNIATLNDLIEEDGNRHEEWELAYLLGIIGIKIQENLTGAPIRDTLQWKGSLRSFDIVPSVISLINIFDVKKIILILMECTMAEVISLLISDDLLLDFLVLLEEKI